MNYTISNNIEIYPYENGVNIFNKDNKKMYVIGEKESRVLLLLDGNNTIDQLANQCPFFTKKEIIELLNVFDDIGVFGKRSTKKSIFKIQFRVFNPNFLFKSDSRITSILAHAIFMMPILFVIGLILNILRSNGFFENSLDSNIIVEKYTQMEAWQYLVIFFISYISLMMHELGHTIVARYYNVNVPEIGFMLYFFFPVAYSNVSCANLLKSAKKRIIILLSGIFCDLGLIGLSYTLLIFTKNYNFGCILFGVIFLNIFDILLNCLVFIKFDGYYIMEVLISEPGFAEKSNEHLKMVINKIKNNSINKTAEYIIDTEEKQLNHVLFMSFKFISSSFIPVLAFTLLYLQFFG